jgi:poly-gamma-glutamate synthesis protein (capsule biosynthesis protein)
MNPVIGIFLLQPTWTMAIGGDIMLNSITVPTKPLAAVAPIFSKADFACANLEIPLTNATSRTTRKTAAELRARSQYILRASTGHIRWLKDCGFEIVSLANNHAMDYRQTGMFEMRKLLREWGIADCGAGSDLSEATRVTVIRAGGLRIGMLSFLAFQSPHSRWKCTPATQETAGIAEISLDPKRIRSAVAAARNACDVLAVFLHWGIERQSVPTQYQVSMGRAFIDAGVDIVIGAHPHVLQGAEMYRGKPILYSMGNLISPRPGSTGIVRLTYLGTRIRKLEFIACSIQGGRVRPSFGRANYGALCKAVGRRFPNPHSREPKVVAAAS